MDEGYKEVLKLINDRMTVIEKKIDAISAEHYESRGVKKTVYVLSSVLGGVFGALVSFIK